MAESDFHIWANKLRERGDAEKWERPIELTGQEVLSLLDCIDFYRNEMRQYRASANHSNRELSAARHGEWFP